MACYLPVADVRAARRRTRQAAPRSLRISSAGHARVRAEGVMILRGHQRSGRPSLLLAMLLAGLLVALVPLAHASPPDETWISGLYDDGDYDDVVLALVDAISLPAPTPL